MADIVLQLCVLSIISGAVSYVIPEGGCKNICQILCTAALILCIIEPFQGFDFDEYAVQSALMHEYENKFLQNAQDSRNRLNKTVIELEYCEYIMDKAKDIGISQLDIELSTNWDTHEIWVPYSVDLKGSWSFEQRQKLTGIIEDELGIPEERQRWKLG